ncbi:MAG: hypothetical protein DWG80_07555, partial [Chloroflexi bacterium]|nr:hypothetical protein [Chloroflexota bacterium]
MTVTMERTTNAVARIADHAAQLHFDQLDPTSVLRARQTVLDTLGTTLGGYQTVLGKRSADFAASFHAGDAATLVGDGRRSTVEGAAFANAVMSKHLGMDDSHRTAGHVAAELVPLALALGEARRLDGRTIVTALAAGYDVFDAIQPNVKRYQR